MGLRRIECRGNVGKIDATRLRVGDMPHRLVGVISFNGFAVAQCAAPHGITSVFVRSTISGDSAPAYNGSCYLDPGTYDAPADPVTQVTICSAPASVVTFTVPGWGGRWD
jgi:hypothetical protein